MLGISGLTNDMRELLAEAEEHDDRRARLAIEIFCYRARKYIGAYLAVMGGANAIVFTGGIGENSPGIRAQICQGLEWAGIRVNDAANCLTERGREGRISPDSAGAEVWVIPTDEELLIARDTYRVVHGIETRYWTAGCCLRVLRFGLRLAGLECTRAFHTSTGAAHANSDPLSGSKPWPRGLRASVPRLKRGTEIRL